MKKFIRNKDKQLQQSSKKRHHKRKQEVHQSGAKSSETMSGWIPHPPLLHPQVTTVIKVIPKQKTSK